MSWPWESSWVSGSVLVIVLLGALSALLQLLYPSRKPEREERPGGDVQGKEFEDDPEPCTGDEDCACDQCFNSESIQEDDDEDDNDEFEDEDEDFEDDDLDEDYDYRDFNHRYSLASDFSDSEYARQMREYLSDVEFRIQRLKGQAVAKLSVEVAVNGMPDGDSGKFVQISSESAVLPGQVKVNISVPLQVYKPAAWKQIVNCLRESNVDKFRSEGMDTWEVAQGEAGKFGIRLADELLEGRKIFFYVIQDNSQRDVHKRLLVVITFEVEIDGKTYEIDYQAFAIRTGAAVCYNGSAARDDDYYRDFYTSLEEKARSEKLGAWGLIPLPERPEVHRRKKREGQGGNGNSSSSHQDQVQKDFDRIFVRRNS